MPHVNMLEALHCSTHFSLLKILLIQAPFNNNFLKFYVLFVIMGFLTLPMKARHKEMHVVDVISNLSCISCLSVHFHLQPDAGFCC